jgi:integrase
MKAFTTKGFKQLRQNKTKIIYIKTDYRNDNDSYMLSVFKFTFMPYYSNMANGNLNLNFNLRKASSDGLTPINLVIRYNNQKLVYPTGEHICPKYWQDDKTKKNYQRVKPNSFNTYAELNARLDNIEGDVREVFRKYKNDHDHNIPSPKVFKELLDIALNNKPQPIKSLIPFIKKFIEDARTRKNPKTGKPISKLTIKKYQTTLNHLLDFCKITGGRIDFEDMTLAFHAQYNDFLSTKYNMAVNSIGKDIVVIKTFLNAATEVGINKHLHFKGARFSAISEKSDSIYLNEAELHLLNQLDLTDNKTLESVRDLFLVGCYTGVRYSDYDQLRKENIKNGKLVIDTYKTGATVIIPLHPIVEAIFDKYDGNLPRRFSNQKTNQYLKEIGEKVDELKAVVTKKITKGNALQVNKLEKYKLITTHTARRSFATNLYLQKFPTIEIMRITGHRTEGAFMRYIKMTPDESANRLEMFWAQQLSQANNSVEPNKDQRKLVAA